MKLTTPTLVAILALLAATATPAGAWFGSSRTATLELPSGTVDIMIDPDRGRPLALRPEGPGRWSVDSLDEASYGRSYSVEIVNRTPERLKVVVAIDGVNVYDKVPCHGRSDRDVGSLLGPWDRRTLAGWQRGLDSAERFVFAPTEWSEGRGIADADIGTLRVDVYRERPPWPAAGRDSSADKAAPRSRVQQEAAGEQAPAIGTTSGDEIRSRVRVVAFEPLTLYPEARAEIDYGRRAAPPQAPPVRRLLGLELVHDSTGALVASVEPGSSADRAGVRSGDVLVRVDAERRPDPRTVRRVVEGKRSGDRVFLWVRRGPHELALKLRVS